MIQINPNNVKRKKPRCEAANGAFESEVKFDLQAMASVAGESSQKENLDASVSLVDRSAWEPKGLFGMCEGDIALQLTCAPGLKHGFRNPKL